MSETEPRTMLSAAGRCVAPPPAASPDRFPDTRWTWIRQAGDGEGREAFELLCRAYWYPIYCFLRRHGAGPTDAGDVTQDFFLHLLKSDELAKVTPREDARFRSWLRTCAKRHLLNSRRKQQAEKHGGKAPHLSIDCRAAERRLAGELMHQLTPDRLFDRCWARTVTERARAGLLARYSDPADVELANEALAELSGTAERLPPISDGTRTPVPSAERTRKCRRKLELLEAYKRCLRREIHGTVGTPALIDEEIRLLLDVLPCRKTT